VPLEVVVEQVGVRVDRGVDLVAADQHAGIAPVGDDLVLLAVDRAVLLEDRVQAVPVRDE
jgi:hypothetical protein